MNLCEALVKGPRYPYGVGASMRFFFFSLLIMGGVSDDDDDTKMGMDGEGCQCLICFSMRRRRNSKVLTPGQTV